MKNGNFFVHRINQFLIDIFIFAAALVFSFFIRFEGIPDPQNLKQLLIFFVFIVLARVACFQLFSVYAISWRYISIADAISIVKACIPVTMILLMGRLFLPVRLQLFRFPYSVIAMELLLVLLGAISVRIIRRLLHERSERDHFEGKGGFQKKKKVLLIGAGNAGNMVAKELKQRMDLGIDALGFIDDDPIKRNMVIQGIRVLGNTDQLPEIIRRMGIEEAIITIANASSKDIRRIVDVCEGCRIKVNIIPGLFEMLDGSIKITKIREINIDDLLGRSVIDLENHLPEVAGRYSDKKILITGAGGSIGSELCRQLASLGPRELILLDKDENSIYEIEYELRHSFPVKVKPVIADIRNEGRLRYIFDEYRPDIVFHAAAHKHVPLMEFNAVEAVLNNVGGTRNVAVLADQFNVQSMISISTDKAVNPTNIMGATKKIGEIIIQDIASRSSTNYSCVRFGNVLGSRGSVVPLFKKQIAQGGPITITHPDVVRYFMSISEAVQLIIQAGTIGQRGEIFVLDMGEPIKIVNLAKDMIKLSGYSENDIEIQYVGLRPGEKLFEEILIDEERTKVTHFKKIFIAPPIEVDGREFFQNLENLLNAANDNNLSGIIECLKSQKIGFTREMLGMPLSSKLIN
jgi:FlaA1/EpsC-like NDP-sugar epimerase